MARDEWGTPQSFFDLLDAEFGFEVDVCALPENAKCREFYSPVDDGLKQTWSGVCWMNPPYGRPIADWMKKALESSKQGATVVCLVPTRTNAPWWHESVMLANEIRFIRKKMSFTVPEGENWRDGVPFTGHAVVIFYPHGRSHEYPHYLHAGAKMKTFHLNRLEDASGVSGTGIVAHGVEFSDGECVLKWRDSGSIGIYSSLKKLEDIHGHQGRDACGDDMRVLVACEFSGIVREVFRRRGHDAWSCDLLPTEDGSSYHLKDNVVTVLSHMIGGKAKDWDMLIAHPPCTRLTVAGARWFKGREAEQQEAIDFVLWLARLPTFRIAIENPIGVLSTRWRKPDQIIQPWQFGHGETKATCLWLKNLPKLTPTNVVEGREARVHKEPPGPDRWKNRSRTYTGIADAMAEQWGILSV